MNTVLIKRELRNLRQLPLWKDHKMVAFKKVIITEALYSQAFVSLFILQEDGRYAHLNRIELMKKDVDEHDFPPIAILDGDTETIVDGDHRVIVCWELGIREIDAIVIEPGEKK
ncbi:hypothetical protein IID24_03055 [Patescibacteria group bacterium]|nr:hypothetical protein [Patescibacteria group bacterium]